MLSAAATPGSQSRLGAQPRRQGREGGPPANVPAASLGWRAPCREHTHNGQNAVQHAREGLALQHEGDLAAQLRWHKPGTKGQTLCSCSYTVAAAGNSHTGRGRGCRVAGGTPTQGRASAWDEEMLSKGTVRWLPNTVNIFNATGFFIEGFKQQILHYFCHNFKVSNMIYTKSPGHRWNVRYVSCISIRLFESKK